MLRVCVNMGLDALVFGLWWRFSNTRTGETEDVPAEACSRETKNLLLMPSEGKERTRVMTPPTPFSGGGVITLVLSFPSEGMSSRFYVSRERASAGTSFLCWKIATTSRILGHPAPCSRIP